MSKKTKSIKAPASPQALRDMIARQEQATVEDCAKRVQAALTECGCQLGCTIQAVYDPATGTTRHYGQPHIAIKRDEPATGQ